MRRILVLLALLCSLGIKAQDASAWSYQMPKTEDGLQRKSLIDLYIQQKDHRNALAMARFGRKVEPECYYFASKDLEESYFSKKSSEVTGLADSIILSRFATPETFQFSAWVHEWDDDLKSAFGAIDMGLEKFPENFQLLKTGMTMGADHEIEIKFNQYGQILLHKFPADGDTYYQYLKYYHKKERTDYSIIMGELALSVSSYSPHNVEIKRILMNNYNRWLQNPIGQTTFNSLRIKPKNLFRVRGMSDLMLLQNVWMYNFMKRPNSNFLEERLYNYKRKVLENCNWVAYWYEILGITTFPDEYGRFLDENSMVMIELKDCLKKLTFGT